MFLADTSFLHPVFGSEHFNETHIVFIYLSYILQ